MSPRSRRGFLADVGKGMLVVSVGPALARDMGLASAMAGEVDERLTFGSIEPLVSLMQQTSIDRLLPALVEKVKSGTTLKELVAAGALANARTFGGQDYIGFHTLMALPPALDMSRELPDDRRALPVFKVLYRNTNHIQTNGGGSQEQLHPIHAGELPSSRPGGEQLQQAVRGLEMETAEKTFAAIARGGPDDAFNELQWIVQDDTDVHRVVLAYRAFALLEVTGLEHAHTLLRQSVRYCVQSENGYVKNGRGLPSVRQTLPKLLDQYRLLERPLGDRQADDAWIEEMSRIVFGTDREHAADAVAAALADGMSPQSVGEAISVAANRLVLHDPGRRNAQEGKPLGSVHGDSVGVHASDAANAWRNIAQVSNHRNTLASLIVAAYHTAGQSGNLNSEPYPAAEHLAEVGGSDPAALLAEAEAAIRDQNQFAATAIVHRYGELGGEPAPVFNLLLRYATSEDGALHAEKYYRTVSEEFGRTRQSMRWRQLAALARVTASEFGRPAPGYAEACRLLGVS
ncbi:MAG: hypothetical protein WD847_10715 [Pirellulales bacterium]